jgi:hypothetical protein
MRLAQPTRNHLHMMAVLPHLNTVKSLLLLLGWLLDAQWSLANISAPPQPDPGQVTGNSPMGQITVLHEDLTLDLSGVAAGRRVKVVATYTLQNPAAVDGLELIFVANNLSGSKYRVALNGRPVGGHLREFDTIPPGWLPPDSIKGVSGTIPFAYTHEGLIALRINHITAGRHTLHVTYEAEAGEWFDKDDRAVTRTFVYILQPSTDWKQFKSLRARVILPDGWGYTSNLALTEEKSGVYAGNWVALPARHFSIALHKPTLVARVVAVLFHVIAWFAFGLLACRWMNKVARYRVRRNDSRVLQVINDIFISFLAAAYFFVIYFCHFSLEDYWLDGHLSPWETYGIGYAVFAFPLVWIVAFALTMGVDYRLTGRIKKGLVAVPECG